MIKNLDVEIDQFFSPLELKQMAHESKFVQRESKLTGAMFFDLIVFNNDKLKEQSLNELSIELLQRHKIEIQKQSLQDRFNNYALVFLKAALEKLLEKQLDMEKMPLRDFECFNRVLIKDSVCFQIDESLAEDYPGSGGSGSGAAVRIQFEYDLKTGRINDLSLNAFTTQDASDSLSTLELTKEGDLLIRDLAYMSLKVLKKLIAKKAFILCRANTNTKIYEKAGSGYEEIKFAELTGFMRKNGLDLLEKEIYLGTKELLPLRLAINLLPKEEVKIRTRKARKNNKKKGRGVLSKEYKSRIALNLFITNTSEKQIAAEKAWFIYRIRWQIELVFKIWKSICQIDKVKKVKKERLECYIYGKLILIILGWQLMWSVAKRLYEQEKKVLSFYKAFKTLLGKQIMEVRNVLMDEKSRVDKFVEEFCGLSKKHHLLEKKKGSTFSMKMVLSCE